jgi:hypothetical protein
MKAIIEFNLPEDQNEYELCNKAQEMSDAIKDVRDYLRSKVKYETQDKKKWEGYDEVYQQFFEIINNYNIKL